MRLLVVLPLLAACADSYGALSIEQAGGPPLGVGLVEQLSVMQDFCEGGVDGTCDPTNPPTFSVDVGTGADVVSIIDVESDVGTFTVAGLARGSATLDLTGADGAKLAQPIDVVAVAQTTLSVPRGDAYPALSPVRVLRNSHITIAQQNLGAGGTAVSGKAPLVTTSPLATVEGDVVELAAQPGTVQITAAAATLELDVVDDSALADFTLDGTPGTSIVLYTSVGRTPLLFTAADATGRPIVGGGGPPTTLSIGDARVIAIAAGSNDGNTFELDVQPVAAGNTTLQVTWGQVTKTFAISVIAG